MGLLGDIFGGLFGMANSALQSQLSYSNNKALQENQAKLNYQYAEKQARNNPTWNRAGLESAGFNPMLAVQNATSGANSNFAGTASAQAGDFANAFATGVANARDAQRLKNETHVSDTTANKNEADAREANARATRQELENPFVSKRQQAEIGKISAETSNIERNTEYFEALEHNMEVMQRLQQMGINLDYKAKIYGANQAYNASTFASKINEVNNIRTNKTNARRQGIRILGSGLDWYHPTK